MNKSYLLLKMLESFIFEAIIRLVKVFFLNEITQWNFAVTLHLSEDDKRELKEGLFDALDSFFVFLDKGLLETFYEQNICSLLCERWAYGILAVGKSLYEVFLICLTDVCWKRPRRKAWEKGSNAARFGREPCLCGREWLFRESFINEETNEIMKWIWGCK